MEGPPFLLAFDYIARIGTYIDQIIVMDSCPAHCHRKFHILYPTPPISIDIHKDSNIFTIDRVDDKRLLKAG